MREGEGEEPIREGEGQEPMLKGQNINYWYNDYRTESATYYWDKAIHFYGENHSKNHEFCKKKERKYI